MKRIWWIAVAGAMLAGCAQEAVVDVPDPNRQPRKEYSEMTQEEKIEFINRTPLPADAKAREIERIRAGTSN